MANRQKGWDRLNHTKQIQANKTRNKVEKVVTQEGDFLYFMLKPAKRLRAGWNTLNRRKTERKKVAAQLKHEEMTRRQKRNVKRNFARGNANTIRYRRGEA